MGKDNEVLLTKTNADVIKRAGNETKELKIATRQSKGQGSRDKAQEAPNLSLAP